MDTAQLLGNFGEFVGSIAVVTTLIYLAMQIRQNTHSQRLAAAQNILGTSSQTGMISAVDEPLSNLLASLASEDELTGSQRLQLSNYLHSVFSNHWQVHYQYVHGFLDEGVFDAYRRRNIAAIKSRHVANWWDQNRFRFSTEFQDYIEDLRSLEP
jgi:hypothetical protein